MEITWYGDACIRLRGREGVVVADGFRAVLGPTGRGVTADIATYSHREGGPTTSTDAPSGNGAGVVRPTSLEPAFVLDAPGEYEVHDVLVTGVRTYRDEVKGATRGENVSFVYQLDGLHVCHLGDIGHLLSEDMLGELGTVDIVCVPVGGVLNAARTAELVAQLDPHLVVPLPTGDADAGEGTPLGRFLHEMGVQESVPQPKLVVTISSLPEETTLAVLESRARG